MKIKEATQPGDIEDVRTLFREYERWLGMSLCFQNFEEELKSLPGKYAPPRGRLLLVYDGEALAGCIALRPLSETTCEMKRLFLRPQFHGKGFGRKMIDHLINEAREIGYSRMNLDTMPGRMDQAISLYRAFGFEEIEPYYDTPVSETIFMGLTIL